MVTTSTVLVVDDDRLIRILLKRALEAVGLNVMEADTGQRALAQADLCRPSLVLLDYHLPDLDGPEVARALRAALGTAVPILLLTASQDAGQLREALEAGANGYVSKPVDARTVTSRVRAALEAAGSA
jgi:DNA-binding response OmpR family regulator